MDANRPKLYLEKTLLERFANIVGIAGLLGMAAMVVFNWGDLPDTVPTHFNGAGEADGWGSKYTLLIMPFTALFVYILLLRYSYISFWKLSRESRTRITILPVLQQIMPLCSMRKA